MLDDTARMGHARAVATATERRARVLMVDDDGSSGRELVHKLVGHGHVLTVETDAREALRALESVVPDVVIIALGLANVDSLAVIKRARELCGRRAALVALAGDGRADTVVEATRHGADQVLQWPQHAEALPVVVARALEKPEMAREAARARLGVLDPMSLAGVDTIVGAHPVMQELLAKVQQVAQSRATVLIHGETGTGKELIAAALHQQSKRALGPFVRLNCAALADSLLESEFFGHERGAFTGAASRRKGRFEQADRGTLFLDEVSEISPSVQVKLLRFLQEREFERVGGNETLRVDVRVIAATNKELKRLVDEGRFREDLYYRLNVVRLDVPPLRARPSDITLLAAHFLRRYAEENEKTIRGYTQAALDTLLDHPFPGNVRELQNAVEQAVVLCRGEIIDVDDLPITPKRQEADPLKLMIPGVSMAELERYAILRTLEACDNSPTRAATILGISRRTIQYRLQEWGLSKARGRDEAPDERDKLGGSEPSDIAK